MFRSYKFKNSIEKCKKIREIDVLQSGRNGLIPNAHNNECQNFPFPLQIEQLKFQFNPLVPDAHYSERQDKPFSLQMKQLEFDLK